MNSIIVHMNKQLSSNLKKTKLLLVLLILVSQDLIAQQNATNILIGAKLQSIDNQSNKSERATIKSITVNENEYNLFLIPD